MHRHEEGFPHNSGLKKFISSFRHTKLSGSLASLYSNRIIQQVASGLIGIFFPILLYTKFNQSLYAVLIYFAVSWGLWFILAPVGAKIMSKIGLKKSLIISVLVGWSWYYFIRKFEVDSSILFLGLSIIALKIDQMLYWIPYHTDFAKFTDKKTRGKQMAFLIGIASLVSIAVPAVSGQIISNYGYDILFLIALIIYVISIVPLFLIPEVRENYSFGYFETYKEVFKKKNRKLLLSYGADGVQNSMGAVVWPVFMYLILNGNYAAIGLISSLVILGSLIIQLVMGDLSDRFDKHRVLKWGTILNAVGWFFKIFVSTGFQIFVAGTYHSFATIVMRTPFDALMYEQAADSGHYIDEYTVIREVSLNIGRLLMLACVALIFFATGSIAISFVVGGLAALAINYI